MSDTPLQQLTPDQALEILAAYARRTLGVNAEVGSPSYREDFQVWESWVAGVEGYVKAYIVRLGATKGEWICRHITVMESAPPPRRQDA